MPNNPNAKDNLTPFTPDNAAEMGARGGKAKAGSVHISTIIQQLQDGIDWDLTSLKSKAELKAKYGKNGMKALVYVAFSKAMAGDVKAMEFLAKNGYGSKIIIGTEDPVEAALRKLGLWEEENDAGQNTRLTDEAS